MQRPDKLANSFAFVMPPLRESRILGTRFQFERSTALGFSPDTFLRVFFGRGLEGLLEEVSYGQYLALRSLRRAEDCGAKMHSATQRDLEKWLGEIELGGAPLSLDGLRDLPNSLAGPWRILRITAARDWNRIGRRLFTRLAYYDRIADQVGKVSDPVKSASLRRRFFLPSVTFWHECEASLGWEMALCLDATLQHLVWLDAMFAAGKPGYADGTLMALANPVSSSDARTNPTPMRRWFDGLLRATRCANLLELHQYLLARGAVRHGRPISHDLLKKWASSQQLMPHPASKEVLRACGTDSAAEIELIRLRLAKVLTFLIECVACFTHREIEPLVAQRAIHERLQSLQNILRADQRLCGQSLFVV